jgi:hypothetical protein
MCVRKEGYRGFSILRSISILLKINVNNNGRFLDDGVVLWVLTLDGILLKLIFLVYLQLYILLHFTFTRT